MDLDLALHPLENGVTATLLGSVLSGATHWLRRLNGAMRAANCGLVDSTDYGLVPPLGARLSDHTRSTSSCAGASTDFLDKRSAHADLGSATDDRTWGESLSGLDRVGWVDRLLLDNGGLITRPDVGLVRLVSTARIGTQVFDLADVGAAGGTRLTLDVVQDDALDLT